MIRNTVREFPADEVCESPDNRSLEASPSDGPVLFFEEEPLFGLLVESFGVAVLPGAVLRFEELLSPVVDLLLSAWLWVLLSPGLVVESLSLLVVSPLCDEGADTLYG